MNNKKIFKKPYGYKEAFILVGLFPLIGLIIEIFSKSEGIVIPRSPYNIQILLGIVLIVVASHLFLSKKPFFKWIATVHVSIVTIGYTTILVLLMAFIPQEEQMATGLVKTLGLAHLSKSWTFLFTGFFLLYNLGLVILRRFQKL